MGQTITLRTTRNIHPAVNLVGWIFLRMIDSVPLPTFLPGRGTPPRKEHGMNQPWENEPDYEQFTASGLPAIINRNRLSRSLCGYVGITPNHRLNGEDYETVNRMLTNPVHGGITYSGDLKNLMTQTPGTIDRNLWSWFFGFDCAHYGDYIPSMPELGGEYRDIDYVRSEIEKLANQLANM